jgi:6-pyruvoyl-tetrahydropterin synthase-like protein
MRRMSQMFRGLISHHPFVAILLAGLVLEMPLLIWGPLPGGHDTNAHLAWYTQFSQQLWSGDVYPRWLSGLNAGLGSPALFVYGPLPYFVASFLKPLLGFLPMPYPELAISIFLCAILGGVAVYLWLRTMVSRTSALTVAILYMAMPYHLWADNYSRFALAEFWAMTWMPFTLYFLRRLILNQAMAFAGLAATYGCLATTHLFMTLMFSPVLLATAAFTAPKAHRRRALTGTCGALLLGAGLAAFYTIPAMSHQQYLSARQLAQGAFSYQNNFLAFGMGLFQTGSKPMSWHCSWIALNMLLILVSCAILSFRGEVEDSISPKYWLVVSVSAFVMMFPISAPVWKALPALQDVQFPWRFLAVLSISVCPLLAAVPLHIRRHVHPLTTMALIIAAASVGGWLLTYGHVWYLYETGGPMQQKDNQELAVQADWLRPVWCKWSDAKYLAPSEMRSIARQQPLVRLVVGTGSAKIVSWKPREIWIRTDTREPTDIVLRQFYYPKWLAQDLPNKSRLRLEPAPPEGLTKIYVPAGAKEIVVELPRDSAELLGLWISAVSVLLIVWLLLRDKDLLSQMNSIPL